MARADVVGVSGVQHIEAAGGDTGSTRLTPAEWARGAEHGEYRAYSVFIMFRHLARNDFLHAYRIEGLLLRPDWAADTAGN